jgi:hypothetical protein
MDPIRMQLALHRRRRGRRHYITAPPVVEPSARRHSQLARLVRLPPPPEQEQLERMREVLRAEQPEPTRPALVTERRLRRWANIFGDTADHRGAR